MKRLFGFVRGLSRVELAVIGVCVIALTISAVMLFRAAGTAINEKRVNRLETEKQQAFEERDAARAQDLILQGKIEAKDEVIKSLTSQIAESNQRVINAHNETQTAKTNVSKVRTDKPHFNSADDAGRILELGSELRGLYSDSP